MLKQLTFRLSNASLDEMYFREGEGGGALDARLTGVFNSIDAEDLTLRYVTVSII